MAKEKILLKENDLLIEEKDSVIDIRDLEIEKMPPSPRTIRNPMKGETKRRQKCPPLKKKEKSGGGIVATVGCFVR